MNSLFSSPIRTVLAVVAFAVAPANLRAQDAPAISADALASQLSELTQDGATYVRLRMDIAGANKDTLQLQIKQRRSKGSAEVVYQVLWPKERKGESVLLRRSGRAASGSVFVPPNTVRSVDDMKGTMFGSDLAYADVVEDFFAWDQQAIVGTDEVDGVRCQILESKPGKSDRSIYGSVKSWIDTRRMVPLRVEKFSSSGQSLRRIDTTRVVTSGGRHIPANLTIRTAGRGSSTMLDGSRIRRDVPFTERDFSADGLKDVSVPRGSQE
jgi:hypothetical protein